MIQICVYMEHLVKSGLKIRFLNEIFCRTNGFVVYGINIANYSFTFDLPQLTNKQVVVYIIKESEPGNLESKTTNLNGELMEWTSHEANVNMKGNVTTLPIEIPAYSQFFIEAGQTPSKKLKN